MDTKSPCSTLALALEGRCFAQHIRVLLGRGGGEFMFVTLSVTRCRIVRVVNQRTSDEHSVVVPNQTRVCDWIRRGKTTMLKAEIKSVTRWWWMKVDIVSTRRQKSCVPLG